MNVTRQEYLADLQAVWVLCGNYPTFMPIVSDGKLFAVQGADLAPTPTPSISAEDFVLNMEALGLTFHMLQLGETAVTLQESTDYWRLPPAWRDRAWDLIEAFSPDRRVEVIDYLRSRGDEVLTTGGRSAA